MNSFYLRLYFLILLKFHVFFYPAFVCQICFCQMFFFTNNTEIAALKLLSFLQFQAAKNKPQRELN